MSSSGLTKNSEIGKVFLRDSRTSPVPELYAASKKCSQMPRKSAPIVQLAQNLRLWKNCVWGVKAGECLLLFFSCSVRSNQRQSRADSSRRYVGRLIPRRA